MIDISAQRTTLSPDYLLMVSNEVCMWARFQGNIHDAHVGTGNHGCNQKLSRDPLQDLGEAFQRGERAEWQEKKRATRVCSVITLRDLGRTDISWSMVMLSRSLGSYVAVISDAPGGWGCSFSLWAFFLFFFLSFFLKAGVWSRERQRTSFFCKGLWAKLCPLSANNLDLSFGRECKVHCHRQGL